MREEDLGLSECHIAPIIAESEKDWDEGAGPCSYCGEKSAAVPFYHRPDRVKFELYVRRYKDGDYSYGDLEEHIGEEIEKAFYHTISAIQKALQPGKPKYRFNEPVRRWERVE